MVSAVVSSEIGQTPVGVADPIARCSGTPVFDAEDEASALYNMALAEVAGKPLLKSRGVLLDKLRVSCWTMADPDQLVSSVFGLSNKRTGKGRRIGDFQPLVWEAWSGERGADGVVYYRITDVPGMVASSSRRVSVEFNPQKIAPVFQEPIGEWLRAAGGSPESVWVERFDAAFDYTGPRGACVLDDPQRKSDRFECDHWGCESERSGYRRGSKMKFQVYDKTAERAAAGVELPDPVVRFECQWWNPDGVAITLPDLASMAWPFGRATMRHCICEPSRIADHVLRLLTRIAIAGSLRMARNEAKLCCSAERKAQFLNCIFPEPHPSPRDVWASSWRAAVVRDAAPFLGGVACST